MAGSQNPNDQDKTVPQSKLNRAPGKSEARVAAGRINALRRRTWNAKQREAARERALKQQPWKNSTGPRSQTGRERSAANLEYAATLKLLKRAASNQAKDAEMLQAVLLLARAYLL